LYSTNHRSNVQTVDNSEADHAVFSTNVRLQSTAPVLVLEELDELLNGVKCKSSAMELRFIDSHIFAKAHAAFEELRGGYVISSHSKCNSQGERDVFRYVSSIQAVQSVSKLISIFGRVDKIFYLDVQNLVGLETSKVRWEEAFQSFSVDFGHSSEQHSLRGQNELQRRDVTSTTVLSPSTTTAPSFTETTLVPSGSPTASSVSLDLAFRSVDSTFEFPAGLGPSVPVKVGCKECKTTGSMILTQGSFDVVLPQNLTNFTAFDYIQSGFVSLELDDFTASILLTATPSASTGFVHTLFNVPIAGFVVRDSLLPCVSALD
jgi:hypothetical protein